MWTCPRCGRSFKKLNQSHYCGEKTETVEAYILEQDGSRQKELFSLRDILRRALPEAEERISWSMPTYWKGHNIVHFSAAKNHIGFYPGPEAVAFFSDELKKYKTSKGSIRLPYGSVDAELIERIAAWCWETGNHA